MKDNIDYNVDKIINLKSTIQDQQNQISKENLDILFYPDIGMSPTTYFLAFSRFAPGGLIGVESASRVLSGQVMAIFIIAIGAAEAALALSLVIAIYREKSSIEITNSIDIKEA